MVKITQEQYDKIIKGLENIEITEKVAFDDIQVIYYEHDDKARIDFLKDGSFITWQPIRFDSAIRSREEVIQILKEAFISTLKNVIKIVFTGTHRSISFKELNNIHKFLEDFITFEKFYEVKNFYSRVYAQAYSTLIVSFLKNEDEKLVLDVSEMNHQLIERFEFDLTEFNSFKNEAKQKLQELL